MDDTKLSLFYPWPPSGNVAVRHARGTHYRSKEFEQFLFDCRLMTIDQLPQKPPRWRGSLSVMLTVYPPDWRKRDLDNLAKTVCDALVYAGVIEDDRFINMLALVREPVDADYPDGAVIVNVILINPQTQREQFIEATKEAKRQIRKNTKSRKAKK